MKKIFFLLALAFGLNLSAQSLYKQFDADAYAQDLSDKIITKLDITNGDLQEKIQNQTYIYAQSLKKHLLLAEKNGNTQGKTLQEALSMVKNDALNASGFLKTLEKWLNSEQMGVIRELL